MICPRCNTENGNRTICSKCGYYMYRPGTGNRRSMTKSEVAKEDAKIIGKRVFKFSRVVWIILVMVVMSFWILALLMYLSGGIGLG